jgi:hypothetical protein
MPMSVLCENPTHGLDAQIGLVADHMIDEVDAGLGQGGQQGVTVYTASQLIFHPELVFIKPVCAKRLI